MDVFFFFPGRVWIAFYFSLGSEQTKNLTGQSPLSVLEPSDVILNFGSEYQTNLAVAASLVRDAGKAVMYALR